MNLVDYVAGLQRCVRIFKNLHVVAKQVLQFDAIISLTLWGTKFKRFLQKQAERQKKKKKSVHR